MSKNWHDDCFFGLHFDLHANEHDTALGKDLSVDHLIQQLNKIKPDFVQCDCKGHRGMTSYPTQVGIPAPHIEKDAVKIWREATAKIGIPLGMHYSGVWDTAALEKHPEWARINSPKIVPPGWISSTNEGGRDKNMTCPLSPYTDEYMAKQLIEIIDLYDVDGFWVDGENWAAAPCYCDVCKGKFVQSTGLHHIPMEKGEENWTEWLEYSRHNFEDHVRRFTQAVHDRKPSCTVCSNWMYTMRQPDRMTVPVDYISGDFDWVWSAQRAIAEARMMDGRNISWDLMAWGFTSYGPMKNWTFKTVDALCQEAAVVMSCGGAFMIYDQPNRTGDLVEWHMDILSEVARFCRARQEYCQHSRSVPQVVLLHDKDHYYSQNSPLYNFGGAEKPIEGALHAVLDNHYHVDILCDNDLVARIDDYKLCIVAEQDNLSAEKAEILKNYVRNGGNLIVSGAEHTRQFDDISGVADSGIISGEEMGQPLYIPDGRGVVTAIGNWRFVKAKDAAELEPLLLSRDTGAKAKKSGSPAAVIRTYGNGKIALVFGPVFGTYYESHYLGIRRFIGRVIDAFSETKLIKVDAPLSLNVTVREKNDNLMINLVNMTTDKTLSPRNSMIEHVPPAGPVKIEVPLDDAPLGVYLAPANTPVKWNYDGEIKTLSVELIAAGIHDIVVIERKPAH